MNKISKKLITTAIAVASVCVQLFANPDMFTITAMSSSSFTISRSDASAASSVYYYTQNGSAVGGKHFTHVYGTLNFAKGETIKSVSVALATPTGADMYGSDREYYMYIYNTQMGIVSEKATITSSKGSVTFPTEELSYDIRKAEFIFYATPYELLSEKSVADAYGTNDAITYYDNIGQAYKYKFNVHYTSHTFTDKEGWRYIGINVGGKASQPWATHGGCKTLTGATDNLYNSVWDSYIYKAFTNTIWPIRNYSTYGYAGDKFFWNSSSYWNLGNNNTNLHEQKFNTGRTDYSYTSDGYFAITKTAAQGKVGITFDGSGGSGSKEKEYIGSLFINIKLFDDIVPSVTDVMVNSSAIQTSGNKMTVAVRFNEIVTCSNPTAAVKIGSANYTFTYSGGSGTNVLCFTGTPITTGTTLTVASIMGTIQDIAGNSANVSSVNKTASIKLNTAYSVTLNTNSGIIEGGKITSYVYGIGATLPTDVTKKGYEFAGWYDNSACTGTKVTSISTTASGNNTYYAKWTPCTYTVTLNNQNATTPGKASVTATYGSTLPSISSNLPTRTGYTFGGYYTEVNFRDCSLSQTTSSLNGTQFYTSSGVGSTWTFSAIQTIPTTLYAMWTANSYTVSFDKNGGSGTAMTNRKYCYDQSYSLPSCTYTRSGYTFKGWATSSSATSATYGNSATVSNLATSGTVTLYAIWEKNKYTITLNNQSATTTGTKSVEVYYGDKLPEITVPTKVGNSFAGYYSSTNGSGTQYYKADGTSTYSWSTASSATLYAYWETGVYSITYNNNNGTITTENYATQYNYGTSVALPSIEREGCDFGGWFDNANCSGSAITSITTTDWGDKVFYAKWIPKSYSVALNPTSGTIKSGNVTTYTYGTGAILPTATNMERTGYVFAGWYDNESCSGEVVNAISVTDFGSKEFWAAWEEGGYVVTFQTNGGTINEGNFVSYKFGTGAVLPTNVTKVGYTFAGWYENSSCTGTPTTEISETDVDNKSFWAKWTENTYSVTLNANGGDINNNSKVENYTYSVGASLPTNVTKTGYVFAGWFNNEECEGSPISLITTVDYGDKEYWAKWEIVTYDITFNINGGTILDETIPESYQLGQEITLPENVERVGYTFGGWFNNSNFTNERMFKIENNEVGDKVYYAKWFVNTYSISLETNGGTINSGNVESYTYGYGASLPVDVTKIGYSFAGWFDADSNAVSRVTENDIDDLTFYAHWNRNMYLVTLNVNEGYIAEGNVESYTYGEKVDLPTNVSRVGYTFKGWYVNSNFDGSPVASISATDYGNKSFWAKWQVNTYSVSLQTNGGTINSKSVTSYEFGSGAILPTDVVRTGYTFLGWFSDAQFESNSVINISPNAYGDTTFYAKWIANVYNITFNNNGGIVLNETVPSYYTYGTTTVELPDSVNREGYVFGGWFNNSNYLGEPQTVITSTDLDNKEFWAKWIPALNIITFETDGGIINSGLVSAYSTGDVVVLPIDVTKTGYTFLGWYSVAREDAKIEEEETTSSYESIKQIFASDFGDKVYYAWWNKNQYEITYLVNQGKINGEYVKTYEYGTTVELPTDVTRDGYTFAGWYSNSNYDGSAITSIDTVDFGNKYFYAKWTINSYKVSVEYDKAMGTVEGTGFYKHGEEATLVAKADAGFEFVEWTFGGQTETDSIVKINVTADSVLTATFKQKEIVYALGSLVFDTLKTETEILPINLDELFASSENGEISYLVSSSAPNVVLAQINEGKLYLSTMGIQGKSTITVTAKLKNGEKAVLKADAVVEYNCDIQVSETIKNVSCYGLSDGKIELKAEENYQYQWVNENNDSMVLQNIPAGNYSVVITDERGCKVMETYTVAQPDEIIVSIDTVENPRCDKESRIILKAEGDYTYLWSNGSTEKDLIGAEIGDYEVIVTEPTTGCSITLSQSLEMSIKQPEIALVTVSKETGHNLIVWIREATDQIDYYTVYRETKETGTWDPIGTIDYNELSVFEDEEADVADRQWSYKISATDYCGNETGMSAPHTTLHLQPMPSLRDNTAELIWKPYVGIDYSSFYIIRETKVDGYTFIDTITTVPSTLTSYSAELPSVGKSIFYVGIKLGAVISPLEFLKAESGPFSLAFSNIAEAENKTAINGISESDVEVYAIEKTIFVNNAEGKDVSIYDNNGRCISQRNDAEAENEFSVRLSGVYFVKVGNESFSVIVK